MFIWVCGSSYEFVTRVHDRWFVCDGVGSRTDRSMKSHKTHLCRRFILNWWWTDFWEISTCSITRVTSVYVRMCVYVYLICLNVWILLFPSSRLTSHAYLLTLSVLFRLLHPSFSVHYDEWFHTDQITVIEGLEHFGNLKTVLLPLSSNNCTHALCEYTDTCTKTHKHAWKQTCTSEFTYLYACIHTCVHTHGSPLIWVLRSSLSHTWPPILLMYKIKCDWGMIFITQSS